MVYRYIKVVAVTLMVMILLTSAKSMVFLSQLATNFQIYGYSYKSSANEPKIYPGSRYVLLVIDVMYSGSEEVYIYSACLDLPPVFSPSRGYSSCSGAMLPNTTSIRVARPGDIITFRFYFDISRDAQPGNYNVGIWLIYGYGTTTYDRMYLGAIAITVSDYPPLAIEIVDNYWSPEAYPGSQNTYLYIVLRNRGSTDIIQGIGVVKLQPNIFTPSTIRFSFTNLGVDSFTTIAIGPLSIYPEVASGVYYAELGINATLRTPDGVLYTDRCALSFSVLINAAPYINIKIVDYGFVDVRVSQGSINAQAYVTIINQDFVSIRSIIARFTITSGGKIVNGSKDSIYILTTPLYYGSSATLYTDNMVIDTTTDTVMLTLTLLIFAERDGAEFWSTQTYTLSIPVKKPEIDIDVVEIYWSGGDVYPGSKDSTLVIILENRDIVNVKDAVASLKLPEVFYPSSITISNIDIPLGSRTTLIFNPISISPQAAIGSYIAALKITGIAYTQTGSFYTIELEVKIAIAVAEPRNRSCLEVVSYNWITSKAYTSMVKTGLQVHLRVVNPFYAVVNPQVTFYLPPGMIFDDGNRSRTVALENRFNYGQLMLIQVQGINIYSQEPMVYPVVMELRYLAIDSNGIEFWNTETITLMLDVYRPSLDVTLIDFGWLNEITTGYTNSATLYVSLQSFSIDTIKTLIAIVDSSTPTMIREGGGSIVTYVQQPIGYGDIVTLTFSNLEILCSDCSQINISLLISAIKVVGSAYYKAEEWIYISIPLTFVMDILNVVAVNTYYGASPAPLLPTARNIRINIVLANNKPYDIAWIKPITPGINISNIFTRINSVEGSCLSGLTRGGTCNLVLDVDVSPQVKPGAYVVPMEFLYAIYTRNAIAISKDVIRIPISVANLSYYMPSLRLLAWHWGTQIPIRVYPGQKNVPLSVVIVNDGVYIVRGVELYLHPRNSSVKIIEGKSSCATTLVPNNYCTAVFYVDIDVNAESMVAFDVEIRYVFTEFGVNISNTKTYTIALRVDEYAAGRGLNIIDYSWANNWPAYPATDNATYVVRLYNSWPYRVSGVIARLILPEGFTSKGGNVATAYIQGPIQSLQAFDVAFTVSIDRNVKPGRYSTRLELEYVVESGAPYIKIAEAFEVYLQVHSIENAISLVQTKWVSPAPEPKTYGVVLAIAVRNNYVPTIRGPILEVYTDNQYILLSDTNTTYGVIPATNIPPESIEAFSQIPSVLARYIPSSEVLEQIRQLTGGGTMEFSYGSIMYFYLRLNLLVEFPKVYSIKAYLNFIDQWNNVRRIPIEIPIHVLGSSKILKIDATSPISIINGEANLTIVIQNIGSAPIYNVYIYIIPQTPLLIPSNNLVYVDVVYPNKPVYSQFKLVYNPTALFVGMTTQYVRYSSAIFIVTVLFRDVTGTTKYLNLTLAIPIEPFIELRILSTKTSISGNYLYVSGVVVNYGLATARSVEVLVIDDNEVILGSSFLGDLDPASQYAFRIEVQTSRSFPRYTLRIMYRDEYNRVRHIDNVITVSQIDRPETTIQTAAPQGYGVTTTHIITIIIVALFLVFVGLSIYRYLRRHIRKLEERIEV